MADHKTREMMKWFDNKMIRQRRNGYVDSGFGAIQSDDVRCMRDVSSLGKALNETGSASTLFCHRCLAHWLRGRSAITHHRSDCGYM